jgi:hypothetical protein
MDEVPGDRSRRELLRLELLRQADLSEPDASDFGVVVETVDLPERFSEMPSLQSSGSAERGFSLWLEREIYTIYETEEDECSSWSL